MNVFDYYTDALRNYFNFSGRSRRKAFWFFILISTIISIAIMMVDYSLDMRFGDKKQFGVLESIYNISVFIPTLALGVRRLHDIGRSGWWMLLIFLPFLGILALIVMWCINGGSGTNGFGPDPKINNSNPRSSLT